MSTDHLDDDALSAALDGEATPEEAAHAESCATCAARLEELRRAALRIGTAPPLAAVVRDDAIAAALDAAPISLEARRRRRFALPPWVAAAAVVLVLVGLAPVVLDGGGDDDQTAASAPTEEAADSAAGGADGAAQESLMVAPEGETAMALGEVSTGLEEAVRSSLPPRDALRSTDDEDAAAPTASSAAAPCDDDLRAAEPDLGALLLSASATFEGEPAEVVAYELGDRVQVYVLAPGACTVLTQTSFAP